MSQEPSSSQPHPPEPHNKTEADDLMRGNVEYGADLNLNQLHASILREKDEPIDGLEPMPLWLVLMFALLIFWGGAYLSKFSGGFDPMVYEENEVAYGPNIGGGAVVKTVDPIAIGKRLYTINCASCHQATGLGVAGQYPPVVGAELVLGTDGYGENHLGLILLHGLAGPLKVAGTLYNGNMPAWETTLKDDQIAHILTFMRQEWGNQAPPVSPEGIAALRAQYASRGANAWSDEELRKVPAAALAVATPAAAAAPAKP
jgi:mono/diheme cytochrome c family protein